MVILLIGNNSAFFFFGHVLQSRSVFQTDLLHVTTIFPVGELTTDYRFVRDQMQRRQAMPAYLCVNRRCGR